MGLFGDGVKKRSDFFWVSFSGVFFFFFGRVLGEKREKTTVLLSFLVFFLFWLLLLFFVFVSFVFFLFCVGEGFVQIEKGGGFFLLNLS